ncbi:MAG: hypothetical protein ACE5GD_01405 [Candidatus Geothermarchaeales archaeon]
MVLKELNERRRLALIENIYRLDLRGMGYKRSLRVYPPEGRRFTITKNGVIDIAFDISHASDYRDDAYRWCYVDFFITTPNINLPDPLKATFTRVMDPKRRRLYWRRRGLVRIIDMNRAAEHIDNIRGELSQLLREHSVIPREEERGG